MCRARDAVIAPLHRRYAPGGTPWRDDWCFFPRAPAREQEEARRRRAAEIVGLPKGERLGWHSLRRKFATELKHTALKDLCYMGGWKNPQTLLTCYQQPDEGTMRAALAARTRFRASWG